MRGLVLLVLAACGRIGFDEAGTSVEEARGQLALGAAHTCALRGTEVWCWGDGRVGETGTGQTGVSPTPVRVTRLPPAASVTAGGHHSCALTLDGDVYCWGSNSHGQNGADPMAKPLRAPFEDPDADIVIGLPKPATAISAGGEHTCALLSDRTVWCWGRNSHGQLGTGTVDANDARHEMPEQAVGLANVIQIAIDEDSSCALDTAGRVFCWGENSAGQLGNRGVADVPAPLAMTGFTATAITIGGDHACALIEDGRFACWGANYDGELGVFPSSGPVPTPRMSRDDGYLAIEAGPRQTCAITAERGVRCWGANDFGQLGAGTFDKVEMLVDVGITDVSAVVSSNEHTCALRSDGTVKCWGVGSYGQLGDGRMIELAPRRTGATGQRVVAGFNTTCAIDGDNASCWGQNYAGQLGNGTFSDSATPVAVDKVWGPGLAIGELVLGDAHACARVESGDVWCWGANNVGQLGDATNTDRATPAKVLGLGSVSRIATTIATTCAVNAANDLYCWGYNDIGQIGDGTTTDRNTPVMIGTGYQGVVGGVKHFCALQVAGGVDCWGWNIDGQLGNGTTNDAKMPASVPGVSGTVLWAGGFSTCLRGVAQTFCWGDNNNNLLLGGTMSQETTPIVSMLADNSAATEYTACMVSTGTASCWGGGPIGDGTFSGRSMPGPITLSGTATSVVLGHGHGCAVTSDDGVHCWGENLYGQLGLGTMTRSAVPVIVAF